MLRSAEQKKTFFFFLAEERRQSDSSRGLRLLDPRAMRELSSAGRPDAGEGSAEWRIPTETNLGRNLPSPSSQERKQRLREVKRLANGRAVIGPRLPGALSRM